MAHESTRSAAFYNYIIAKIERNQDFPSMRLHTIEDLTHHLTEQYSTYLSLYQYHQDSFTLFDEKEIVAMVVVHFQSVGLEPKKKQKKKKQ